MLIITVQIFSLCFQNFLCVRTKFPVFSLSGKSKNQIPCFPCFPCAVATLVCHSVHRGVCFRGVPGPGGLLPGQCLVPGRCLVQGECLVGGGGAPGGVPGPGGCLVKTSTGRVLLRALRILLECILVFFVFLWCFYFQTHTWPLDNCWRHATVLLDSSSLAN